MNIFFYLLYLLAMVLQMSKYGWRKPISVSWRENRAKFAFKTQSDEWVDTEAPVLVPFSIHSSFHRGIMGELKVNAFISVIKSHVKGKITILFPEFSHLQVLRLKYQNNYQFALDVCLKDSEDLIQRFNCHFEHCEIVNWEKFIVRDSDYGALKKRVKELYQADLKLQSLLDEDARATYTQDRMEEFPHKSLYIERAIEDLLERAVYLFISAKKGYRFEFYPGKTYLSIDYINRTYLLLEQRLSHVEVSLSVLKKSSYSTYYASTCSGV